MKVIVNNQSGIRNSVWVTDDPLLTGREGSRDLLLELWDPLHILGMGEARNFKFGTNIHHEGH